MEDTQAALYTSCEERGANESSGEDAEEDPNENSGQLSTMLEVVGRVGLGTSSAKTAHARTQVVWKTCGASPVDTTGSAETYRAWNDRGLGVGGVVGVGTTRGVDNDGRRRQDGLNSFLNRHG